MRETVKRGGSGACGMMGYDFNIITGQSHHHGTGTSRHDHLQTSIPRVTRNVTELKAREVDAWGDSHTRVDLVSNAVKPQVRKRWREGVPVGGPYLTPRAIINRQS